MGLGMLQLRSTTNLHWGANVWATKEAQAGANICEIIPQVLEILQFRPHSVPRSSRRKPIKTGNLRGVGRRGRARIGGKGRGIAAQAGGGGFDQGKTTTPSNLLRQCFLRSIPRKVFLYVNVSLNLVDWDPGILSFWCSEHVWVLLYSLQG